MKNCKNYSLPYMQTSCCKFVRISKNVFLNQITCVYLPTILFQQLSNSWRHLSPLQTREANVNVTSRERIDRTVSN